MSRRHAHPVFFGAQNNVVMLAEIPMQHPERNIQQAINEIPVPFDNVQAQQPIEPVDAVAEIAAEIEPFNGIVEVVQAEQIDVAHEVEIPYEIDPITQIENDFQFAQALDLSFQLEMQFFVEEQDNASINARPERTKRETSRLNHFKCNGCRRNVQADNLPECETIEFFCDNCANHR